nr:uncharacterized protein LOC127328190 [Lolium perenne]
MDIAFFGWSEIQVWEHHIDLIAAGSLCSGASRRQPGRGVAWAGQIILQENLGEEMPGPEEIVLQEHLDEEIVLAGAPGRGDRPGSEHLGEEIGLHELLAEELLRPEELPGPELERLDEEIVLQEHLREEIGVHEHLGEEFPGPKVELLVPEPGGADGGGRMRMTEGDRGGRWRRAIEEGDGGGRSRREMRSGKGTDSKCGGVALSFLRFSPGRNQSVNVLHFRTEGVVVALSCVS